MASNSRQSVSARLIRQASLGGKRRYSAARAREEVQPLLEDADHGPAGTDPEQIGAAPPLRDPNLFLDLPVFDNIWKIRREIIGHIADPYTLEQLRAPRLNTSVVRPLMQQFYEMQDISVVYALLVNRLQFMRDQSYQAHYLSVNTARATLCELLAIKILRQFDEDSFGQKGLLLLSNILIAGFEPFQGAPSDVQFEQRPRRWPYQDRGGYENHTTALELAIISESKLFLSAPACQKVIDAIYVGRIVYTPTSWFDIIPDTYKHRAISLYNPRKAPVLNQYRLSVPRTRNVLEVTQFLILLGLFFLTMETRDPEKFTTEEIVFCIYAFGWILDQLASIFEHGWRVYSENLWSFLDVVFACIYIVYFVLRMHGIQTDTIETSAPALDILAMGAPLLIPRLAFNVFSENLLFVSLREMMARFLVLTLLAVWSFAGFFLAMYWLGAGRHQPVTIGKWMVWVWFGLDGTGIQRSTEFHWLLGPLLMISFAVLGNTLFLTILVSTLSNTFSRITRSAVAEIQFRRAVLTFEGVKSDAIFAYQPPFNLLALFILVPLKLVVSQRWFHKINITAVRVINFPLLLVLCWYERRHLWPSQRIGAAYPHRKATSARVGFGGLSHFHVHGDLRAVFEHEPPADQPPPSPHLQFQEPLRALERKRSGSVAPFTDRSEISMSPGARSGSPLRRSSAWSVSGIKDDQMSDWTSGHEVTTNRLEKLEQSVDRIEEMLKRMSESMDDQVEPEQD